MGNFQVRFLGSGDAFGSGGRLQTCIQVESGGCRFLLDCGASALISMKRFGVNPNDIEAIVVSHLHGDHFCGIPFFILDAQLISKRSGPLVLAGPEGIEQRVRDAMEVMFPGSSGVQRKFPVEYVELRPGAAWTFKDITVDPYTAVHASGAPSLALRVTAGDKTIAFTGDTEWTDALEPACSGADALISEAYFFEKKVKFHMDYAGIFEKMNGLGFKRLIITHMGPDMLQRINEVQCEYAEDGKAFVI